MRILAFSLKLSLFLLMPILLVTSCKDEKTPPCSEGDPAIVGCKCNSGIYTNSTGPDACLAHGGISEWICDESLIQYSYIHGTITFDNADLWSTWKDSGDVEVTIFPEFVLAAPPAGAGWGDIPDNFFGPGVPGGRYPLGAPYNSQNPFVLTYVPGQTQYHYELEVEPGTYSALAVGLRNNRISDPSLKTATLGVDWNNPDTVSHGIVLKVDVGGGQIMTIFNDPAPSVLTLAKGDDVEINFKADFAFVLAWFH